MTFSTSVKSANRDGDCKQRGKKGLLGNQEFRKGDSLWLSRKKGERDRSSGSGEERGRTKGCSAPVRKGVEEGEEWRKTGKEKKVHYGADTRTCGTLVRRWRKGVTPSGKGRFSIDGGGWGSLPTVGVLPALSEAFEDKEDELSARASGAVGGGLTDILGGLNGRTWAKRVNQITVLECKFNSDRHCVAHIAITTHNLIDSCEFSGW